MESKEYKYVTELTEQTKKTVIWAEILKIKRGDSSEFTNRIDLKPIPTRGYFVGTGDAEFNANGMSSMAIKGKINQIFNSYPSTSYVGGWLDNGNVIVEISEWYLDRGRAIIVGEQNGQDAIYDIENGKDINL